MEIKLIVSEIDGVITTGARPEDELGHVPYKIFQTKDFAAINELKKNYKFVFLSEDDYVNFNMCKRRNIPFFHAKNEHEKYDKLVDILRRYACVPDEVIFVGAKISDVRCCQFIPKSFCPDDAGQYLKDVCWASFLSKGGEGIVTELVWLLKTNAILGENG